MFELQFEHDLEYILRDFKTVHMIGIVLKLFASSLLGFNKRIALFELLLVVYYR